MRKLLSFLVVTIALLFATVQPVRAEETVWIWPVTGSITTYFSSYHPGIDISSPCGTPVVSAKWGTASYVGWDTTGYGNRIDIDDGIDYERYGHLSGFNINSGQYVSQGQVIGWVGSTGWSTGCHLHFETHWYGWGGAAVDPLLPLP